MTAHILCQAYADHLCGFRWHAIVKGGRQGASEQHERGYDVTAKSEREAAQLGLAIFQEEMERLYSENAETTISSP